MYVKTFFSTPDGRQMLLNVEIENKPITLANIYAPNEENDRSLFFVNLPKWISQNADDLDNVLLAGDFNCCLNDCDRSTSTHLKIKSRNHMKQLINVLHVKDLWCDLNDHSKNQFTWHDKKVPSRLDYMFLSHKASITPDEIDTVMVISDLIGKRVTDHNAVVIMKIKKILDITY